jgi:hypothetical protein
MFELGRFRLVAALAMAAGVGLAAAGSATAQAAVPDEWLPFLGCWQVAEAPADAPLTCVRPAGGGVEILTIDQGEVVESRHLVADGIPRPSTVGGCPGTETAAFSSDGSRVYLEAAHACPGDATRASRGLLAMLDAHRWIEVQTAEVRGRAVAWVQRFEPAPRARAHAAGQADLLALVDGRSGFIAAARDVAAAPITVDQIIEAHARTDAEAVRVWISEQLQPVYLDAAGLIRLADAGVDDEVIDVAVAMAYPQRFAVTRDTPYYPRTRGPVRRPGVHPGYWDPYWGYWGRGYWGPYYRPTVIVVRPRDGGSASAVKGRGYTRGTSGATATSGATGRSSDRPSTSRRGSSNDDTGRTGRRAQPRD